MISSKPSMFNGKKTAYQLYRNTILSWAQTLDHANNPIFGLLGYLLSSIELKIFIDLQHQHASLQTDQSSNVFVLVPLPGTRPDSNSITTPDDIALYKVKISDWDYNNQLYQSQIKCIDELKSVMSQSIPAAIQCTVGHPQHGFQFSSANSIFIEMDKFFISSTAADFKEIEAALALPFVVSNSYEEFVVSHRVVHDYCYIAGQPMSNIDKANTFIKAVNHSKVFDSALEYFSLANPNLRDFNFDNLVIFLRSNVERVRHHDSSRAGSASTTNSTKATTARSKPLGSKKEYKPWTADEKRIRCVHYCWTHGPLCSHTSKDCRKPAAGHKPEATLDNPCGGRLVEWVYPTK